MSPNKESDNKNNSNIYYFNIPKDVKQTGLFKYAIFDPNTEIIEIFVNHKVNGPIAWTFVHKKWTSNFDLFWKEMNDYGINDLESKLLCRRLLNANEKKILELQKSKSQNKDIENEYGEKPKPVFMTFKYTQRGKGNLHESVVFTEDGKPYFIKYDYEKQEFSKIETIEENNRILRLPELEECPYEPYTFLNLPEVNEYKNRIINEKIDRDYLFDKSLSIIKKFNTQDDYKLVLVAADVILSLFQDRFSTIHYDFFVGGNGSGKSSLGATFASIGYRPVTMTDPSAPNLFRLLGKIEPAQCTMILEEADKIDKSQELMAILKEGSARNGKVSRINPYTLTGEFFFAYGLKIIISERSLSQFLAKGVTTRIFPFHLFKGSTDHDIKEALNPTDTGGQKNKELLKELEDFRKLLLVYRLMHFKDPIPDLGVGVEGRDKELVKHLIQLFYGSKCEQKIVDSLQKFLDLKNKTTNATVDYIFRRTVATLVKQFGGELKSKTIWEEFIKEIPGELDKNEPTLYHSNEYGPIYRTTLFSGMSDSLGGTVRHSRDGNIWIFDKDEVERAINHDKTRIVVTDVNTVNTDKEGGHEYDEKNENGIEEDEVEEETKSETGFKLSTNGPLHFKTEEQNQKGVGVN